MSSDDYDAIQKKVSNPFDAYITKLAPFHPKAITFTALHGERLVTIPNLKVTTLYHLSKVADNDENNETIINFWHLLLEAWKTHGEEANYLTFNTGTDYCLQTVPHCHGLLGIIRQREGCQIVSFV